MQRRELLALAATAGAASVTGCVGGRGNGSGGGAGANGGRSAVDGAALARSHRDGLTAAGTYSVTFATRMEQTGSDPLTQTVQLDVDEASGRYLSTSSDSAGVSEFQQYVDGTRVYWWGDGGVTNVEGSGVEPLDEDTRRDIMFPLTVTTSIETVPGRTPFREVGTEPLDGVTVTRYEAEGDPVVEQSVDDVRYVMLVDDAGIVRYFERHTEDATGNGNEQRLVTRSWRFSDIGTTTVVEPDWVGELR